MNKGPVFAYHDASDTRSTPVRTKVTQYQMRGSWGWSVILMAARERINVRRLYFRNKVRLKRP